MIARVASGDIRAGARLMRWLDDRAPGAEDALRALYAKTGKANILGVTGNPGSGKSTLTSRLISHYRSLGAKVGVVCVDPSSPFTGGAILGDRIRMNEHAGDSQVFIRSLATRGALGGLSRSTHDTVRVMEVMGYDPILVETVGVGQDEVDIVRLAHTNLVVLVPGLGDDVQAIKAGILEIADIFVVNKADLPGKERLMSELRQLQSLQTEMPAWIPPIVPTVASTGEGLSDVAKAIEAHRAHLVSHGLERERAHRQEDHVLRQILRDRLERMASEALASMGPKEALLDALVSRADDPYGLAERVIAKVTGGRGNEERK
jgi:LAO/AO transport system kinase